MRWIWYVLIAALLFTVCRGGKRRAGGEKKRRTAECPWQDDPYSVEELEYYDAIFEDD